MKPEEINTWDATLSTFPSNVRRLIVEALEHTKLYIERSDKSNIGGAFIVMPEMGKPATHPALHTNDLEKSMTWALLRFARATNPFVMLIAEAWYVDGRVTPEVEKFLAEGKRPAEHPDRKEGLIVNIWHERRRLMVRATITRKPNKLGPFEVFEDTLFPGGGKADKAVGNLVDDVFYEGGISQN